MSPCILACSVMRREIENLIASGEISGQCKFLDSMLHMYPEKLRNELGESMDSMRESHEKAVVVYGECHAHINELNADPDFSRTNGLNCCEILLGRDEYRRLRKEGKFFLIPEWTIRWNDIVIKELGLTAGTVKPFFTDMHSGLVYIDTELVPVPMELLAEISAQTGLPLEIKKVGLEHLRDAIKNAAASL